MTACILFPTALRAGVGGEAIPQMAGKTALR